MCVCYIFYDDKAMGTHITLSQLDAAPESSHPLGDKPVSQPALSKDPPSDTLSQMDAAALESSYPLGDKPVSQPALSKDPPSDTQS